MLTLIQAASQRAMRRLVHPPAVEGHWPLVTILTLMLAIGIADYATGINVSLAVFYLVPVTLAISWLNARSAVAVALATIGVRVVGDYLVLGGNPLPTSTVWNAVLALAIELLWIWLFDALISIHRELEQRIDERTADLVEQAKVRRQLEHELLQVGASERNAIGQELHDDICQHLIGTAMAAKVLTQRLAEEENVLANDAQSIVGWIEQGAHKTRDLSRGLLLSSIAPEELAEKLLELVDEGANAGVACRFRAQGNPLVADPATASQLFRIAQEAIRNALNHANARNIEVTLLGEERRIRLCVEDDGCGISRSAGDRSGIGLRIMKNRASLIGGKLEVDFQPGVGTRVECELPRVHPHGA